MEKGFFDYLKELLQVINWPVALLIISFLLRKQFALLFAAMTRKVDRPGEVTLSKDGISIKEYVDKKVEETQNETLSILETGVGKKQSGDKGEPEALADGNVNAEDRNGVTRETHSPLENLVTNEGDDPLKISWADVPSKENKNRKISATVALVPNTKLYKIKLVVESTSKSDPLKGDVWFHLHPSFAEPNPVIETVNGKAELNLVTYGSFTVGAETDKRQRKVKLDLAKDVPGVSEEFKNT